MEARFCPACGETRWALFTGVTAQTAPCPLCGETMRVERRRPGRGVPVPLERRSEAPHPVFVSRRALPGRPARPTPEPTPRVRTAARIRRAARRRRAGTPSGG